MYVDKITTYINREHLRKLVLIHLLIWRFPSLSWLAETPKDALKGIREVVRDVIADLKDNGEEVPQPFALKSYSGKFLLRIPPELHRTLAIQAAESGVSINRLVNSRLIV
jgi:predicted HicB family RNase H-like nuclease